MKIRGELRSKYFLKDYCKKGKNLKPIERIEHKERFTKRGKEWTGEARRKEFSVREVKKERQVSTIKSKDIFLTDLLYAL